MSLSLSWALGLQRRVSSVFVLERLRAREMRGWGCWGPSRVIKYYRFQDRVINGVKKVHEGVSSPESQRSEKSSQWK